MMQCQSIFTLIYKFLRKQILISLRAFDETGAIRVLLHSNNFVDLPLEVLEMIQFPSSIPGAQAIS